MNHTWITCSSWAAYGFLAAAVISLWLRRTPFIFGSLLAIASVFAIVAGRLQWPALLFMVLFAGCNHYAFKATRLIVRIPCVLMIILASIALWFHWVPGFSNWLLVKDLVVGQDSMPFSFFLNFDKPLIGLFILGFSKIPLLKTRSECWNLFKKTLPMAIIAIIFMIGVACLVGYIGYDLKWNKLLILFVVNNLLFVSIAEEILCRGFVQTSLYQVFADYRYGWFLALLLASLFFGVLHTGSTLYILLASLAGFCYGLIYHVTKRIEASILTHFLLNTVHLIGFSYPALANIL